MKRRNIFDALSNKEIAKIVIDELEKAGVEYSFGSGGVQFSGFQSTDGKAPYLDVRSVSEGKETQRECSYQKSKGLKLERYKAISKNRKTAKLPWDAA